MAQQQIILPEGANELVVPGIQADDYDCKFDFAKHKLIFSKRPAKIKWISTYLISKSLANAVNAAIVTGRPLLIKGEPGSGKTKLAQAVASYFFGAAAYQYYFEWHVKSKSKAAEGGYVFDHVARLRDATISADDPAAKAKAANPENYITLGAMGKAFSSHPPNGKKPILLIDEIDKGDIDFPNDLLLELDEMRFSIAELPGTYIESPKDMAPLVFITSNSERELPPAFLRRCLYYNIPRFEPDLLIKISTSRITEIYQELDLKPEKPVTDLQLKTFVNSFVDARKETQTKPPSTSEMLDWLKILTYRMYHEKIELDKIIDDQEIRNLALKLNA